MPAPALPSGTRLISQALEMDPIGMTFAGSGMTCNGPAMTSPFVIPGKRSATRNPFPMRCSSAENGTPWPKQHRTAWLFGLKGFRRCAIIRPSARSGSRIRSGMTFVVSGMTFVGAGMTSFCHSGQAKRDPESISNKLLFSRKRNTKSHTISYCLVIWPEGVLLTRHY